MAPFADAHMHLFAHGYHPGRNAPGSDVDRYEAIMEAHNITAALVVGYEGEGIDPDNNAYLRSLAVQRPRMSTVAHLPVSPPPALDHLERPGTAESPCTVRMPRPPTPSPAGLKTAGSSWPTEAHWSPSTQHPGRIPAWLNWFAPTPDASSCSPTSASRQAFILPQLDQLSTTEIDQVMGANLLQPLA